MAKGNRESHRITLDDVARKAGVSKWAASRSFTPGASVAAHKRESVLKAARELGYQPSMLARALSKKQSRLVVIVQDDFANPHALLMLEKMTIALQSRGLQTILVNIASDNYHPVLDTAQQYQASVVILLGTQFDDQLLSQLDDSILLLALARKSNHKRITSVSCNDQMIGKTMAEYAYLKGYRRPLFLSGPGTTNTKVHRFEHFNESFVEQGGRPAELLPCFHYNQQIAQKKVDEYISASPAQERADIICCENDILAMGALDALKYQHGLEVPGDIAVIGVDNIAQSGSPAYDITTYSQPLDQMVALGMEMVSQFLEQDKRPESIILEGELVKRSSC